MRDTVTIHDRGYRGYDGPRLGAREIFWVQVAQGVRRAFLAEYGSRRGRFGLWLLVALSVFPAWVMVSVAVLLGLPVASTSVGSYANAVSILLALVLGGQASRVVADPLQMGYYALVLTRLRSVPRLVAANLVALALGLAALLAVVAVPLAVFGAIDGRSVVPFVEGMVPLLVIPPGAVVLASLLALTVKRGGASAAVLVVVLLVTDLAAEGVRTAAGADSWGAVVLASLNPFTLAAYLPSEVPALPRLAALALYAVWVALGAWTLLRAHRRRS